MLAPVVFISAMDTTECGQIMATARLDTMDMMNPSAVDIAITGLTATPTTDYYLVGSPAGVFTRTLHFAPGQTMHTFYIGTMDDFLYEGNESLRIDLSNPVNATLSPSGFSATAWILDDEINFPPQVSSIPDQFRWVADTADIVLSLNGVFMDANDPLSSFTWTVTPTGAAAINSHWVDANQYLHLDFITNVAGVTNILVRGTDPHGAYAETEFDVWNVALQGMTVEEQYWGDDANTWFPVGDVLWSSDNHKWTTTIQPSDAAEHVMMLKWMAEPWVGQTQPLGGGYFFAQTSAFGAAVGSPGPGDWFIYPQASLGSMQVQVQGGGVRKPELKIVSVEWEGIDPGDGQTNYAYTAPGPARYFPEQNHPTGATDPFGLPIDQNHNKLNVKVTLEKIVPADLPTQKVWVRIKDPGSPFAGTKDQSITLGDPSGDPNDNINDSEDRAIGMTPSGAFELEIEPSEKVGKKQVTVTEPQPGNNYIAAAHGDRRIVDHLHFKADGVTLFYRNPTTTTARDVPEAYRTAIVEVHRTLWVESDRMLPVDLDDGHFNGEAACGGALNDECDDDRNVVMEDPSTTALMLLLEEAFIWTGELPAAYDTDHTIPFAHYQMDWRGTDAVRDQTSSRSFWTIHLLGAYEFHPDRDNDEPNTEVDWLAGWSEGTATPHPTNFVFYETIRDLWAEPELPDMVSLEVGKDRVAAHEGLHRFFGWHGNPQVPEADEGIMDPETLMTEPNIVLTDRQIRKVQQIGYPK